MYISQNFTLKWKQRLQREFRKMNFSLGYKQYDNDFKVYTNKDRSGYPIQVEYKFSEEVPLIRFNVPSLKGDADISPNRKNIIKHVLTDFVRIVKESDEEVFRVIILSNAWTKKEQDKKTVVDIVEGFGLVPEEENLTSFITRDAFILLDGLTKAAKDIDKKYHEYHWDNNHPLLHFNLDRHFPLSISCSFQDVSDRQASVKIDYKKQCYRLTFWSKHHKKEIMKDEITLSDFEDEYELFVGEEKYKALFNEPQLNHLIESTLSRAIQNLYPSIKVKELFDWLLNHYTVEEMTELSRNTNRYDIKIVSQTKYDDLCELKKDDRERRLYHMYIISIWGRYLCYENEDIRFDAYEKKNVVNKTFSLQDDFAKANEMQKRWLFNQIW